MPSHPDQSESQVYCSLCTMIGNTEGQIPATCQTCVPPRHPVCATCWPYPGNPCVCGLIHA